MYKYIGFSPKFTHLCKIIKLYIRMKLNKLCLALLAVLSLTIVPSCKDKDEDTTKPFLDGALNFEVEDYILINSTVTYEASGAVHPDGKEMGYSWKVAPEMSKPDTIKLEAQTGIPNKYTYKFKDTLRTYTITVSAFADGYYAISKSKTVTLVDPRLHGTIKDADIWVDNPYMTDPRDNKKYYITTIGKQTWMRENMAYAKMGVPYKHCTAMEDITGHYYTWEEANKVCPEGWKLPSNEDWMILMNELGHKCEDKFDTFKGVAGDLMVDASFNGEKLWEFWPEVKITNKSKLALLPFGYATLDNDKFEGSSEYAIFWTSDSVDSGERKVGTYRYLVNIDKGNPNMLLGTADPKLFGASVRCIKK